MFKKINRLFKEKLKAAKTSKRARRAISHLDYLLETDSFQCISNKLSDKTKYSIVFLIPGFPPYSGGHTSILRLGTYLASNGHEIYYLTYDRSSAAEMATNANNSLPGCKGTFLEKESLKKMKADIGIATFWDSCYYLLSNQHNYEYKAYFIQDFEPSFYPVGDIHYLAMNTYKIGFHNISLGQWNKFQIEKNFGDINVDYINFPVELGQYKLTKRSINLTKEINFAVYLKFETKRAPFLVIKQLQYLVDKFSGSDIRVNIYFFGIDQKIKLPIGKNMGQLNHEGLKKLYRKAHFGMVASLSNISLVNYEMIASGLPVIDYMQGSAPTYFSEKEMIFIDTYPASLYQKLQYYLEHQDELDIMVESGQLKIKSLTWDNSSMQFMSHLGIW